ncbi:MAG: hypothetical protein WBN18_06260, partial [Flavobacteriaceae bacterium]
NFYRSSYAQLDAVADNYETDPALAAFFTTPENSTDPVLIIPNGTAGFIDAVLNTPIASATDLREVSQIE